jgi:hypothetical protein
LAVKLRHPFFIVNLDDAGVEVGEYGGGTMVENSKLGDFVAVAFEKTYELKNPQARATVCCDAVGATRLVFLVNEKP